MVFVERQTGNTTFCRLPVFGLPQFGTETHDPVVKIKTADDFGVLLIRNNLCLSHEVGIPSVPVKQVNLVGDGKDFAIRCGREGTLSPLQFIVPGMRQIRAGL